MRLRTASLVLSLLLAACQSASAPAPAEPEVAAEPLKIGFIGPLTGDIASLGADTLNGVQMAVAEVNAAGGINGRQVEVVVEDGKCAGADGAAAAQKLVNVDGVLGIVGGQCSGETLAAAPIAGAAKAVLLSPVSSSPDVTTAGEYVFRVYPSDDLKGKAFAQYFTQQKFVKVGIVSETTDFCQGIRASIRKYLPSGVSIVFDEQVETGTKDFRSLFTRLQDMDLDVLVLNGQGDATVAVMLKNAKELGVDMRMVGTDVSDSQNLITLAGEAATGMDIISVPSLEENNAFVLTFTAKYGEPKFAVTYAAYAYDAAGILLKALSKAPAGGADLQAAVVATTAFPGVTADISFDTNGDVVGAAFALKTVEDGKIVQKAALPID